MKATTFNLILSCIFFSFQGIAQGVISFGAGNNTDIVVTASSSQGDSTPDKVVNGDGLDAEKMAAARFLTQAGFGMKMQDVDQVINIGYESWIDQEFTKPLSLYDDHTEEIWSTIYQMRLDAGVDPDMIFGPLSEHFNYAWWQNVITSEDQLRHRMAFCLSQILVVSGKSDLDNYARAMSSYYDVLYRNAFGNYYDLLLEATLHPAMGYYLSHLNNEKSNPESLMRADENYAREIMQLFTIGLHQLNQDGTVKMTSDGFPLPTYNIEDIRELAKVFTGLGPGAVDPFYPHVDLHFGLGFWGVEKHTPMAMYNEHHDQSTKHLIEGKTLPAGQDGMKDVEDAVMHLFNHPNVGPFVARQLIQRLVKSNPTPGYISRVASAFNNNGEGVRGDLKAVIKAILLDSEARSCEALEDPNNGKLREPITRYAQLAKTFELVSPFGRYWDPSAGHLEWTGQMALNAPSVFNFYEPDFQPAGELTQAYLVAPEFKIHNTKTAIGYINMINAATIWDTFIRSWELDYGDEVVRMNTSDYEAKADDIERVLNDLDILLSYGQIEDWYRDEIRTACNEQLWGDLNKNKVRMAIYAIMISPYYTIQK